MFLRLDQVSTKMLQIWIQEKEQKSKESQTNEKKNQQQTSYQRKQCSAYLHPTEIEFSL